MIRRLALTAGLAVISAIALAPKAHAQVAAGPANETVEFSGTVGSTCQFSGTKAGVLGASPNGMATKEVGTSGETTVNCTGGGEVSVSPPRKSDAPTNFTAAPGSLKAYISDPQGETRNSDSPEPLQVLPGANVLLKVDMEVGSEGTLPPGVYEYEVTLTATPQ